VLNVANLRNEPDAGRPLPHLLVEVENRVLRDVERDDRTGMKPGDLAAELGPDRPPGTRHEDGLATQFGPDLVFVQTNWPPAEQVFHIDIAHLSRHPPPFDQLAQTGYQTRMHTGLPAPIEYRRHLPSGGRGHGDQNLFDLMVFQQPPEVRARTQNRRACNGLA